MITSAIFGSVTPKAFCQKRLKLSFGFAELAVLVFIKPPRLLFCSVPAPFFFVSFAFGELAWLNLFYNLLPIMLGSFWTNKKNRSPGRASST